MVNWAHRCFTARLQSHGRRQSLGVIRPVTGIANNLLSLALNWSPDFLAQSLDLVAE